jgi:hypothetical protein
MKTFEELKAAADRWYEEQAKIKLLHQQMHQIADRRVKSE